MSSKRMGWIMIAALTVMLCAPTAWACDKASADAKDAAAPCGAKSAQVAKADAAAPAANAPAVNAMANGAVAPVALAVNGPAEGQAPCPHAAQQAGAGAPCPHAAAMTAGGQAPCAGKDGKPCTGKDGQPCPRQAAETVAQAGTPAEGAKAESR